MPICRMPGGCRAVNLCKDDVCVEIELNKHGYTIKDGTIKHKLIPPIEENEIWKAPSSS